MENVQQLYDQAFQYWEADDTDKAKEYIQKALALAPDDLSVNALAMYIYRSIDNFDFIKYAEFIIDHDIHYKDSLDRHGDPHRFLSTLSLLYSIMLFKLEQNEQGGSVDADTVGFSLDEVLERAYKYLRKILEAGYPIDKFRNLIEILNKTERFDETIEISYYFIEKKSAAAIGLPGLEKIEKNDWLNDDYLHPIMDAFFYSGRNEEALEWSREYSNLYPNDYQIHMFMGEILCRLNRPAETAREWIIMLQKGEYADGFKDRIEQGKQYGYSSNI